MADTREPSPRSRQVYRGGQPEEDKKDKTKTPGEVLAESGEYLKDPETEVDISQPLESRMFDIDPEKHKAQQKQKKIRTIAEEGATAGEQAAGRRKLKDQTDLPQFFQATDFQKQDAKENKEWDEDNKRIREKYFDDKLRPIPGFSGEIVKKVIEAARKHGKLKTPQGQMEMIQVAAGMGTAILMGVLQVSKSLMFSY